MLKLHLQDKIRMGPPFPPSPPQWITFLPFISQNILLNIKDVKFDFSMGCILGLFPFLWIINVLCTNFGFLKFWYFFSKMRYIGLLWSKITIFIIEITLKLLLHTQYGWNNSEAGWGLKSLKFTFLTFLAAQNSSHTQIFKYMSPAQFSSYFFFFNAPNNVLYQNQ